MVSVCNRECWQHSRCRKRGSWRWRFVFYRYIWKWFIKSAKIRFDELLFEWLEIITYEPVDVINLLAFSMIKILCNQFRKISDSFLHPISIFFLLNIWSWYVHSRSCIEESARRSEKWACSIFCSCCGFSMQYILFTGVPLWQKRAPYFHDRCHGQYNGVWIWWGRPPY